MPVVPVVGSFMLNSTTNMYAYTCAYMSFLSYERSQRTFIFQNVNSSHPYTWVWMKGEREGRKEEREWRDRHTPHTHKESEQCSRTQKIREQKIITCIPTACTRGWHLRIQGIVSGAMCTWVADCLLDINGSFSLLH